MEPRIKLQLLERLQKEDKNWIDGDFEKEKANTKTCDIVNHDLKFAIEIKDINYNLQNSRSGNIAELNGVFLDSLNDARRKFESYPCYRTCLFFLSSSGILDLETYALEGSDVFIKQNGVLQNNGKEKKYSEYIWRNTGCFILYNNTNNIKYVDNKLLAETERLVQKKDIQKLLKFEFND